MAGLLAAGLIAVGCGGGASAECAERAGARLCVTTGGAQGTGPRLEVEGFAPGSVIEVSSAGQEPARLAVGPDGRIAGGVFGMTPGPVPEQQRVTGTAASGQPVRFVVTCSPADGCSPAPAP